VDDVGELVQRSAQLDGQHELAHYFARTRSDQGRADQHPDHVVLGSVGYLL
jgi:hypothetical protein